MTIDPRPIDSIFTDIQSQLLDSINKLTNFVRGTFNDAFLRSYADQIREAEIKALAVQLSAYPEYAGKELTEDDLQELGIENVSPAELNRYVQPRDLDKLAEIVGIDREQGRRATGEVTFTVTDDQVEIREGFVVSTEPDSSGESLRFQCDVNESGAIEADTVATKEPDKGETIVSVPVIAEDIGEQFNVGRNTLTVLPEQIPGVISVTNTVAISGGADPESTESLRERTKQAVFQTSGGGTRAGVVGAVQSETDFDLDVSVSENVDSERPVEVVADVTPNSAEADTIQSIIEDARPIGVKHELVTPTIINTGVTTEVRGDTVDTQFITQVLTEYIETINFGDRLSDSVLTSQLLSSVSNLTSVATINTVFESVTDERHTYTGAQTLSFNKSPFGVVNNEAHQYLSDTTTYELRFDEIDDTTVDVQTVVDGNKVTLTQGSDYTVVDTNSSGSFDGIALLTESGGRIPDTGAVLDISYTHSNVTVTDVSSDDQTFVAGTDYQIADTDGDGISDGIEWLSDGSKPATDTVIIVSYRPKRSVDGGYQTENREKLTATDANMIVDVI